MVQVRETRSSMLKRTGDSKEEHRRTVKSTTSHIHSIPQGVTTLHCDITSRPPTFTSCHCWRNSFVSTNTQNEGVIEGTNRHLKMGEKMPALARQPSSKHGRLRTNYSHFILHFTISALRSPLLHSLELLDFCKWKFRLEGARKWNTAIKRTFFSLSHKLRWPPSTVTRRVQQPAS